MYCKLEFKGADAEAGIADISRYLTTLDLSNNELCYTTEKPKKSKFTQQRAWLNTRHLALRNSSNNTTQRDLSEFV